MSRITLDKMQKHSNINPFYSLFKKVLNLMTHLLQLLQNKNRLYPVLLILLCLVLFGLNIWGYPLIDVDEPRYMETAREMLFKPGDWITPHFNFLIRFDKPPLYYWLIASGFKVFGVHEWVGRAISGLSATGIVFGVYLSVSKLLNRKVAFIAGLIIATMAEVVLIGRWAVTDMTLTFWMCGATLSLYLGLKRHPKYFLLAGILAGFGMLTKGPIALLLPGVIAVIYTLLFERQQWKWLISKQLISGIILSIIIALPWYVACHLANPVTFIPTFFGLHNITRFTQTVSGHTGGWGYYIPVVLLGAFPWTLCFAPLALSLKTLLFDKTKSQQADLLKYSLIWFITVFLFFTVAQTKLLTYILLCFPALGIICALLFDHWMTQYKAAELPVETRRILNLSVLSVMLPYLFALGMILVLLACQAQYPAISAILSYCNLPLVQGCILLVFVLAVMTLILALNKGPKWLFYGLLTQSVLLYSLTAMQLIPAIAFERQSDLMAIVKRAQADHAILATWQSKRPSMVYYNEDKVYYLQMRCFHSDEDRDTLLKTSELGASPALMSKALPNQQQSIYKPDRPIYLVFKTRELQNFENHLGKHARTKLLVQGPHVSAMSVHWAELPSLACLRKDINQ